MLPTASVKILKYNNDSYCASVRSDEHRETNVSDNYNRRGWLFETVLHNKKSEAIKEAREFCKFKGVRIVKIEGD
jgi:hypothetical protein